MDGHELHALIRYRFPRCTRTANVSWDLLNLDEEMDWHELAADLAASHRPPPPRIPLGQRLRNLLP